MIFFLKIEQEFHGSLIITPDLSEENKLNEMACIDEANGQLRKVIKTRLAKFEFEIYYSISF